MVLLAPPPMACDELLASIGRKDCSCFAMVMSWKAFDHSVPPVVVPVVVRDTCTVYRIVRPVSAVPRTSGARRLDDVSTGIGHLAEDETALSAKEQLQR